MSNRMLLVCLTMVVLVLPGLAQAQSEAAITQDSCVAVDNNHIRVYFTVSNFSQNDENLCAFRLIPVPSPASDKCHADDYHGEGLWVGSSSLDGGAWFGVPPYEYPQACMTYNTSQGGFYITIEPGGACCYDAVFANSMYENWETITWCVASCIPVPIENRSWGAIKSMYE